MPIVTLMVLAKCFYIDVFPYNQDRQIYRKDSRCLPYIPSIWFQFPV